MTRWARARIGMATRVCGWSDAAREQAARSESGLEIDFDGPEAIIGARKEPIMSATLPSEAITFAPVEPLLERLQARGIRIPRLDEISDYLARHPDVIELTVEVCEMARREFEGIAGLSLELYIDPEIDDPHLTLYVQRDTFDQ